MPFHGAFLIHEMRVRGFWLFAEDREIVLPIPWQAWIQNDFSEQHQDSANGDMHEGYGFASDMMMMPPCSAYNPHTVADNSQHRSSRHNKASAEYPVTKTVPCKTLIMTNPFANPAALEDLKRSAAE